MIINLCTGNYLMIATTKYMNDDIHKFTKAH